MKFTFKQKKRSVVLSNALKFIVKSHQFGLNMVHLHTQCMPIAHAI